MWKKYNCEELKLNNDSDKLIKKIGGIMKNPVVNYTIYFILTILQKFAAVGASGGSAFLEVMKLTGHMKSSNGKTYGTLLDIFIAINRLADVSLTNVIRIDKKLKEINPNTNFIESLINIKFNGDFDVFEKECEKLFVKETSDYAAEQFLVLWLVLSDFLIERAKKNETSSIIGMGIFNEQIVDVVKKESNNQMYTINEKGNLILNTSNKLVSAYYDQAVREYTTIMNSTKPDINNSKIGSLKHDEVGSIVDSDLRRALFGNNSINTILYPANVYNPVVGAATLEFILKVFVDYKTNVHFTNGNAVISFSDNLVTVLTAGAANQPQTAKDYAAAIVNVCVTSQDFKNIFNPDNQWSVIKYSRMDVSRFIQARVKESLVGVTDDTKRSIQSEANVRISEANQLISFYSATKSYDLFKFIINNSPKRLVTLLFDTDSSYSLIDDVLSVIAGVVLGPKYLAHEVSGESATEIIQDYLNIEATAPDPFITKYLEENKFIKEKDTKDEKFNVFITNKDYLDLQKELYEERLKKEGKKELITGGIRIKPSVYRKKNLDQLKKRYESTVVRMKPSGRILKRGGGRSVNLEERPAAEVELEVDEDRVKEKLFMLLGQNAKVINEVLNKQSDTIIETVNDTVVPVLQDPAITVEEKIEIIETAPKYKGLDPKAVEYRIAILTGLVAGSALHNDIPTPYRDSIYKFLCYLSSNARSIDKLRSQLLNILLGCAYFINKINNKIMEIYGDWSKRTGKNSLELFAKEIRQSKQKDLVEKFFGRS